MRILDFDLNELYPSLPETVNKPRLYAYMREIHPRLGKGMEERHPVMIVCPGGGYGGTSDREADPVALQYFAANFHVFILRYSCKPDRYPAALLQVMATIHYVRTHADELNADPERIFLVGFSAGGHLVGSAATMWKLPIVAETIGCDARLCRPDGVVMGYPVVSASVWNGRAHQGSFRNLLGPDATQEEMDALSLENFVDADTSPAFIWHTYDDPGVPVENSLYYALAMRKAGVPCEMHIYPHGVHGLSVCNEQSICDDRQDLINPYCEGWMELSIKWLNLFKK
ncbi:MAG: alpha/beta hydrolase [Ruminococcaceae bacterium]|nr:alpha/beta hydrolase [Oscillospiraceae bacterium]